MRKVTAGLLLGLGSFLLVAALTVVLWGPDAVKKTPLDTDSVTNLSGTADKLEPRDRRGRVARGQGGQRDAGRLRAQRRRRRVFVSTTCLVIDEGDVPQSWTPPTTG